MAEIAVGSTREEKETERASHAADLVNQGSGVFGREFGFAGVFAFTISSIGLSFGCINIYATMMGTIPNLNLPVLIGIALVFALLQAYLYSVIGTVVPRFGADYILSSRILGAPVGFAASWLTVIFLSWLAGTAIASIPYFIVPGLIRLVISVTGNQDLSELMTWFASPDGIVMRGTIVTVVIFGLLILPPRMIQRVFKAGFLLLLAACAIIYVQLASAAPGSFEPAWNALMGENQYQQHLGTARRLGMHLTGEQTPMILMGLMLSFLVFSGYSAPTLAAGEVKDPGKNLIRGSWAAILVSGALLVGLTLLLQRLIPQEWLAAESFLHRAPEFKGETVPWIVFYSAILRPNLALVILVGASWLLTVLCLAHSLLYASSRVVFAWAKDFVLPDYVAFAHPVLRSPLIAVLIVCTVALMSMVEVALSDGQRLMQVNSILMLAVIQVVPVLAVIMMPFRKPEWFKSSAPAFAQKKLGSIPLISFVGCLSLIYIALVIFASLQMSLFALSNLSTVMAAVFLFLLGLLWYSARRSFLLRMGKDLDAQFKQFPED